MFRCKCTPRVDVDLKMLLLPRVILFSIGALFMFEANKLRTLRKKYQITLQQLADQTNVSVSQLSLIERGKVVPTVSVFWKICKALQVPMSYFFSDLSDSGKIVRKEERKKIRLSNSHVEYQLLSANLNSKVDFILVEINPGEAIDSDQQVVHSGEECGYVQQGQLTILLDGKEYLLQTGDSISFPSSLPHRYINKGNEKSVSLWVMIAE